MTCGRGAQREIGGRRLDFIDIERGATDLAGLQSGEEIGFIDDAAAGAIEDADAFFHFGEGGGVDHAFGLVGHRHVDGDEIADGIQIVHVLLDVHVQGFGAGAGKVGIVSEDFHAEGGGAFGDFAADAAHAEDAKGLVVKFGALKILAAPFAFLHGGVGLRNLAGQGHKHGKGQFGGGNGVAAGGVHHDDAALGGGIDIDIVHADAGAADDAEIGGGGDDLLGDLGLGADDHGVNVFHEGQQLRLRRLLLEDGDRKFRALLQQSDALRRNRITNQYIHSQASVGKATGGVKLFGERECTNGEHFLPRMTRMARMKAK